ncbi:MAG TPA: hypothetical protein VJK09_00505 [Candidatus Paceibacterota bacterium]
MKILESLQKEHLIDRFASHRDSKYIVGAITKWDKCLRVALASDEYLRLILNSSALNPLPKLGQFPLMQEAISQFISNADFLAIKHPDRGLSGVVVKNYIEEFKKGTKLKDCFIRDKDANMREEGWAYIADGMHRLVAYGVWKNLEIKDNELEVYLCTNL